MAVRTQKVVLLDIPGIGDSLKHAAFVLLALQAYHQPADVDHTRLPFSMAVARVHQEIALGAYGLTAPTWLMWPSGRLMLYVADIGSSNCKTLRLE